MIYFGLPIIFMVSDLPCGKPVPYYFDDGSSIYILKSVWEISPFWFFQKLSWLLLLFMLETYGQHIFFIKSYLVNILGFEGM